MALKGSTHIVLAVLAGIIGVIAIRQAVSPKQKTASETVNQVVVADAEITSGTALAPNLVRLTDWPKQITPPNAATAIAQVDKRVVMVPLVKGEPILLSKLAPEGSAAGLGGLIRGEMEAFTVKVDDVSGVAGFIQPGSRVDVLMIMPSIHNTSEHLSKLILQDLKVLTAGQVWEQSGTNKPVAVNTVTLEVTPQQAEILNLASTQGKIRLTLRSLVNKKVTPTEGYYTSYFFKGQKTQEVQKTPEAKPAPPPTAKPPSTSIEVIKGTKRSSKEL
jgi:pilus assembly protein CpaB